MNECKYILPAAYHIWIYLILKSQAPE